MFRKPKIRRFSWEHADDKWHRAKDRENYFLHMILENPHGRIKRRYK